MFLFIFQNPILNLPILKQQYKYIKFRPSTDTDGQLSYLNRYVAPLLQGAPRSMDKFGDTAQIAASGSSWI